MGKFPVPDKRFQDIHLDVVRPLSKSRGYRYMLTILDEAIPMIEATSEACCHAFLHAWVARYGLPMSATSDNGNSFIAKLWKDLNSTLNIKEVFVPFYHQATNGIVERAHSSIKKGLKDMLVDMAQEYKQDWYVHLPWVLLSRRVALIPKIGASSAKLRLGLNPIVPGQLVGAPTPPM